MADKIKETIDAKYNFTDKELLEYGQRMSRKYQEKALTTEEFSAIKKQWASKLEAIDNEIQNFSQRISCGYEFRKTDVYVTFDSANRKKYYHRISDGEPMGEDTMTATDFEMNLPLEEEKKADDIPVRTDDPNRIVSVSDALVQAETEAHAEMNTGVPLPKEDDEPVPQAEAPATPAQKKSVKSRKKADTTENPFQSEP